MRKRFAPKSCLLRLYAVILLVGIGVGELSTMGGPYWTYWLGMMILSALLVLVGVSILIVITVDPSFVIQLRGRWSKPGEVKRRELSFGMSSRQAWYCSG